MLENGISIVIPVYGSEASIGRVCEQIRDVFNANLPDLPYEVVLVDDFSPDGVSVVIASLTARMPQVRCISMLRNFGQHNALLAGIREARFDRIITMDDDGQHPASAIPSLVESLTDSLDLVYACPRDSTHSVLRDFLSSSVKYVLNKALGVGVAVNISSFRIFRTVIRTAFSKYDSPVVFIDALLSWGTRRVGAIQIDHQERRAGKSGYTVKKLLGHTLNMVTSFSILPLRFATFIGLLTISFGLLIFSVSLVRFLTLGREIPGFMFLITALTLFSGVQLFSLGVIGEYIARIHMRLMDRPAYVIRNGASGTRQA